MESAVGAKRRKDRGGDPCAPDSFVVLKSVHGIICGTNRDHAKLLEDSLNAEILLSKLFIRTIPDLFRAVLIEQPIDPKIPLQFKMGPVIERIPESVGNGSRPCQKLLVRLRTARAVPFRYTVGSHRAPFVMIALEPYFREVAETMVVRDLFGGKMAVIVQNRLLRRVFPIKATSSFCSQQKVLGNESHNR